MAFRNTTQENFQLEKKQRAACACISCRKRKIKCDSSLSSPDSCDSCIKKGLECIYQPVGRAVTFTDGSLASQSGSHSVAVDDLPPLPQEPSYDSPASTSTYPHPAVDHSQVYIPYSDPSSLMLPLYPGTYSVPGEPWQTQPHNPPTTNYPYVEYPPGPSFQNVAQVGQPYLVPLLPPVPYTPCYTYGGSVCAHGPDCVHYTQ